MNPITPPPQPPRKMHALPGALIGDGALIGIRRGRGDGALIEKCTCYPGHLLETGRLLDTGR